MPHCYSTFWITFGNGAPLSPIWGWKDRAARLPSWAPALLATLEASGCAHTAAEACGRSLATLALSRALLPGLARAWAAALDRFAAQQLPTGQLADELPACNTPDSGIGEEPRNVAEFEAESRDVAEFLHPLEDLPMHIWLTLSPSEQTQAVADYAGRRSRAMGGAGDVRYRGGR